MRIQYTDFIRPALMTIGILAIPLIAMQFTDEVNWDVLDFIVIGVLLMSAGLLYEIGIKSMQNMTRHVVLTLLLFAIFVLIWVEFAVGIIGE